MSASALAVVRSLEQHRLPFGTEAAFSAAVRAVLETSAVTVLPEYRLSDGRSRIDFYLQTERIGVELKVKGSFADVTRQLTRYARCHEIDALVLVSGKARLGQLPATIEGKPLHVVATWRSGL